MEVLGGVSVVCLLIIVVLVLGTLLLAFLSFCSAASGGEGRPLRKLVRKLRILLFFIKKVVIMTILVSGSPAILLAKLKTSTTMLVLVFGSDVLNFITNFRLTRGGVVRLKS